jgi:hypothetical protein
MALTSAQQASRLFKKSFGNGETLTSRDFFEEPKIGREIVYPTQIWTQGALIPTTAPVLSSGATSGVVQYFEKETLTHVSGSTGKAFWSANLVDAISFNFGDGTYNYGLYKNDGSTQIAFGDGDWLVDTSAGLLTFYGTLPSGVSDVLPPKISFYKYVGAKGFPVANLTTFSYKELPSGLINDANAVFNLANPPITGSEHLYLNGMLQTNPGDYTITGSQITFAQAPPQGSVLICSYQIT